MDSRAESVHLKPLPTHNLESVTVPSATAMFEFSSTDFSLWILGPARTEPRRLKSVLLVTHDRLGAFHFMKFFTPLARTN
jgi:hypothetical protein